MCAGLYIPTLCDYELTPVAYLCLRLLRRYRKLSTKSLVEHTRAFSHFNRVTAGQIRNTLIKLQDRGFVRGQQTECMSMGTPDGLLVVRVTDWWLTLEGISVLEKFSGGQNEVDITKN